MELEKTSSVKHEYVAGKIYRMLADAAEGGPCRVHISDMKLCVADDLFYCSNVIVACTPEPDGSYTESEPCLVVEVASPSTETTDRRKKLAAQKKMPALRAYPIVAQNRQWAERHWRGEDGIWRRANLVNEGSKLLIPCEKLAGMFRSPSSRGEHRRDRWTCKMPGAVRVARK